jgi:hypothetical protein
MAEQTETLTAPEFMVEGPHNSVIADPSKIPTPEAKKDERPTWLDEKFKSPEDLATAYKELEKKLGTHKTETPAPTLADAKAKGIDTEKLSAEYAKDGKLSLESLKSLSDAGFTEAHVKAYVEGQQAKATQVRSEFAEVVGGEEQLGSVLKWAETNLDASEQESYNNLIESGNTVAAKIMLKDISARYTADVGDSVNLVQAEVVPGSAGIKPFGSNAEVVEAMQNPKYAKDAAYRRKVEMRLSISDF